MSDNRVLVTGATGFVGSALCAALIERGRPVLASVRTSRTATTGAHARRSEFIEIGSISGSTDWAPALREVGVVVHLAARTHQKDLSTAESLPLYRRENVEATKRLAEMAAAAGVRRFVFLSSIKVNGEATLAIPFTERDTPAPEDPYGISKREAEEVLREISTMTGMDVVIIRPPLIYGPGVKGNFLRLMRLAAWGIPLPLAGISNRRSLLFLGNLVDAIVACIDSPAAAGKTYLVSDGEDVSTSELTRRLAAAMGRPSRLFSFPQSLLQLGGAILGRRDEIARLTGSLQVDGSRIRQELTWAPRFSLDQGLAETARWFLQEMASR